MAEEMFTMKEVITLINDLKNELTETRTLIKQYNGLREKVVAVETKITTLMWAGGIGLTILGLLFTALAFIKNNLI